MIQYLLLLKTVADLFSKILNTPARSKFLRFDTILRKICPNNRLVRPLGFAPPLRNPGSGATKAV